MDLRLRSTAFQNGNHIPSKYTCDGEDISPPLEWGHLPPGTKSAALIADDPDAPAGTWVHWVIYNIPSERIGLQESVVCLEELAEGCLQGRNDFGKIGYGGPCPPGGTHRYFFKLYALNIKLDLEPGATKKEVLDAMKGHVLALGTLIGLYTRR